MLTVIPNRLYGFKMPKVINGSKNHTNIPQPNTAIIVLNILKPTEYLLLFLTSCS